MSHREIQNILFKRQRFPQTGTNTLSSTRSHFFIFGGTFFNHRNAKLHPQGDGTMLIDPNA